LLFFLLTELRIKGKKLIKEIDEIGECIYQLNW